jgi:hypothetical protein
MLLRNSSGRGGAALLSGISKTGSCWLERRSIVGRLQEVATQKAIAITAIFARRIRIRDFLNDA